MFPATIRRYILTVTILILIFSGYTLSCGPSRTIGSPRRRPRKTSPFVYKQHVPNVSEYTLGASGQADGAINRGDPRFKDLVENHNTDIIFRDEERDGSDRIMSARCKEKLNILSDLVRNQWPGNPPEVPPVRVKVKEAWDDNYLHGEKSLHYEGRAVDVATSDRDRSKLGMLARLAVNAGFDWVEYESHGHIHCSVKSDSTAASQTGGCFTGEGIVQLQNGDKIKMSDMRIGDRVLSMRSDGVLEYSEVMTFMDRDEQGVALFYTFYTESGKHITLTAKHLLYVVNQNSSLNVETFDALFADTVTVGQYLLIGEQDSVTASPIKHITVETRRGIYAPLTKHGTIVVDGLITSCYAYIDSVTIAHAVFAPMRIYHDISQYMPVFPWPSTSSNLITDHTDSTTQPIGVHWYAKILYSIGTTVLSRDILFVH